MWRYPILPSRWEGRAQRGEGRPESFSRRLFCRAVCPPRTLIASDPPMWRVKDDVSIPDFTLPLGGSSAARGVSSLFSRDLFYRDVCPPRTLVASDPPSGRVKDDVQDTYANVRVKDDVAILMA